MTTEEQRRYNKQYRIENADALNAKRKADRAANPEKYLARSRASYARHAKKRRREKREWRAANPEKVKAMSAAKYQKNRLATLARMREYEQSNREKINARRRKRHHADPAFRIKKNLARRLSNKLASVGKRWAARTEHLVGCNVNFLRAYLDFLFKPGMSWENYGKWEVDHKIPCAKFDLTDPVEQRRCFHWSNLQPLWEWENASKGAKMVA